jgi:CRISPR-associated endonuclease/helicase Cas3
LARQVLSGFPLVDVRSGAPIGVWAKLKRDPESGRYTAWHPLISHAADVAACAEMLLLQPTWTVRLARLAGVPTLGAATVDRLCVLAALHDLGKCNRGFQARGRPTLGVAPAGHVGEAVSAAAHGRLSMLGPIDGWGEAGFDLLIASICHHGRPVSVVQAGPGSAELWRADRQLDPPAEVARLFEAACRWFPRFSAPAPSLPDNPAFGHAFAGLVMLADWIGSDESLFPFADSEDGDARLSFARQRAAQFAEQTWLSVHTARRAEGKDKPPFLRVTGGAMQPRPAQLVMASLPDSRDGALAILESETGSGKTEAALAHFVRLFSAGQVDGLYFALPTRTAATEIHTRVLGAMRFAFQQPPPVALAVPGYLRIDDQDGVRPLCGFEVLWNDDPDEATRHRRWASESAKRYLAACVAVGTVDQLLLSQLRVPHAHLRASAALRQLLVVDEVHASDAYMIRVLEQVLRIHLQAGGHALLLSATLSAESRARLLGAAGTEQRDGPTLHDAVESPYPLVSYAAPRKPAEAFPVGTTSERTVQVDALPVMENAERIAELALAAAAAGAKVLVLRNTVADCVATQDALEKAAITNGRADVLFRCEGQFAPHHSRYARPDRLRLDRALQAALGGDRFPGGLVVVATQTVQQALDVDADLLLTDLCPIDVLLQRIGRLHRHVRARSEGFAHARCRVLVPAVRDLGVLLGTDGTGRHHHGLGSVYDDLRMLEACWRQVERRPQWTIPVDCRSLVENGLHSKVLAEIAQERGAAWIRHSMRLEGDQYGKRRLAELNLVEWQAPYAELTFESGAHVATRLGESDRRVRLPFTVDGPFGQAIDEFAIPARWLRGTDPQLEFATDVRERDGCTHFEFAGRMFRYDRLGLRPPEEGSEPPTSNTMVEVD